MGFWGDALQMLAPLAGTGAAIGSLAIPGMPLWAPLVAGAAGQGIGTALTAAGTRTRTLGPSDADIANVARLSRREGSAQIKRDQRSGQQQYASQAAQGNLLGSGLYGGDVARLQARGQQAGEALEGRIQGQSLGLLSQRRQVPELSRMGIFGQALASTTSPLTYIGMARLLQAMGPQPGVANAAGGAYGTEADRTALAQPLQRAYGELAGGRGPGQTFPGGFSGANWMAQQDPNAFWRSEYGAGGM